MPAYSYRSAWLGLFVLLGVLYIPAAGAKPSLAGVCPPVSNTTQYTIVYGDVTIDDVAAPVGSVVEARSPRGDTAGCWVVTTAGSYGMMYVYGEDATVNPTIPGMRANEPIAFRVNGATANPTPGLIWTCLLYTSPSPRDRQKSRMPSSA